MWQGEFQVFPPSWRDPSIDEEAILYVQESGDLSSLRGSFPFPDAAFSTL